MTHVSIAAMEFLFQYGLFLAEALTVVIAFLVVLVLGIGLTRRAGAHEGIEVTHLNRRYEQMTATLEQAMLSKQAAKAHAKAKKAQDKAQSKADSKARKRAAKSGESGEDPRPRLFVLDFHGDLRASGASALREEITAVLGVATVKDEVLVRVDNAGGMVHGHGLAASQLARLREKNIPLTISVDKVAASGGYMMACVADRILAAPFAIVGSIGVLAQIPNFHRLLDRAGVDFELIKAGEHKRTLTLFGENTPEDREKMQQDVENVHALFKRYVARYRPSLDIEQVATGEHWHGVDAIELGLVDELQTSDDYLMASAQERDLYAIKYAEKQGLSDRLASVVSLTLGRCMERLSEWSYQR